MISFKERVRNECIKHAKGYYDNFIRYEYLICSRAFKEGYHLVKADKGNYLHLTGVHTHLTAEEFFDKCYSQELEEADFDFIKPNKTETSVKGAVRDKIIALPDMINLFDKALLAEDDFKKNRVKCAFATSDNRCTLGFIKEGRPKSLLRGNELNSSKMKKVDLIFRKPRSSEGLFKEKIYGDIDAIVAYQNEINELIDELYLHSEGIKITHLSSRRKYMEFIPKNKLIVCNVKRKGSLPACFRSDTYSEKLKQIKLKNKLI